MGVDDEYRAVAANEDSSEHLLEKSPPITRAAYKKRSMAASVVIGAFIGAGVMFLFSAIFSSPTTNESTPAATTTTPAAVSAPAKELAPSPTTVYSTATVTVSAEKEVATSTASNEEATDYDNGLITDCGGTPDEARAKGCTFDVMMQLWMPAACYDSNLSERYLSAGNWTWWADGDASRTLTLDEMREGEHTVIFVVQDYHKQHCIFAWEKSVRALRNDEPVIEELISIDHMTHCKHRTLSEVDANVRGVRAPTGYSRCAKYDTWLNHMPENTISSVD